MSEHHHEHDEHGHHHDHSAVEIHEHEGALAASFRKEVLRSEGEVNNLLRIAMKDLADELRSEGAFIGHIKASVKPSDTVIMLSITKDIIDEKIENSSSCSVSFAAIVFNIDVHELEEHVSEVYNALE
jgi:hypothetical protein